MTFVSFPGSRQDATMGAMMPPVAVSWAAPRGGLAKPDLSGALARALSFSRGPPIDHRIDTTGRFKFTVEGFQRAEAVIPVFTADCLSLLPLARVSTHLDIIYIHILVSDFPSFHNLIFSDAVPLLLRSHAALVRHTQLLRSSSCPQPHR